MSPKEGLDMMNTASRRRMFASAVVAALACATAAVVTFGSAVSADPGPTAQHTDSQVTADALPTTQIDNGVVWSTTVINGIAYAGGNFSNVRPSGAAQGTSLTARGNLVAINLSTGDLVTSFAPSLNGQVRAVAGSPDGTRLYVGGAFTSANGTNRYRIAAYSTATGQLISTFAPTTDATVNAITATNTTVYVGGIFSQANGVARSRLAAFNASDGSLTGWAPTTDYDVNAIQLTPDQSRVIIGGGFGNVNGAQARGSASLDAVTGASMPWAVNQIAYAYKSTQSGAILNLSTDGNAIYGTAFNYGDPSNFEGVFSADPTTGAVNWLEDCHGDTYGAFGVNSAVYVVSHEHFCSNVGGFPDTNPRSAWYRSTAFTAAATGTLTHNQEAGTGYGDFGGQPSPSMINWFPSIATGTFTGQSQGAWAVSGNSKYIVEGGEFPSVNGTKQYGLVRFAVPSAAPNKRGPQVPGTSASASPSTLVTSNSTVRISWQANWDQDDQNLTYSIYRADKSSTVPVYQTTAASQFWNMPVMGFTDSGLKAGTAYTYWLRTTDPAGNVQRSNNFTVTIPSDFSLSPYARDVLGAGASHYWRLDEAAGATTSTDWSGYNNLVEGSTVTNGVAGAINGDTDTAATFDGSSTGVAGTQAKEVGPNTFSAGAWFRTTTTSGGKLLGFGDSQTGTSGNYDRHVYLDNAGHIVFGVYNNGVYAVTSRSTYNDGQWHQVVATLSGSGMVLYVDGKRVGTNGGTTQGQAYSGYWRVGGDNLSGWPGQPSSNNLAATIDDVAVYPAALTLGQVQQQYVDSGRSLSGAPAPTDTYGKAVAADAPDLYYRLDETTGTTAQDASANGVPGTYSGGYTLGTASPVSGTTGTAVTFNGSDGGLASTAAVPGPSIYSEEVWFKAGSTTSGKLIGFGNAASGNSGGYDRHVYMTDDGHLVFGTYTGNINTATSTGTYQDNAWHQVVATQGADGMKLYVDGQLVGTNSATGAQSYDGYWRIGGDNLNGWPSQPSHAYFNGSLDEMSIYSAVLSPTQVAAHYKASPAAQNVQPVAAFTPTCTNLSCTFDASASSDADGTVAGYAWDFGDGAQGTGVSAQHTYTAGGTYTVTLRVTDDQGGTSTAVTQVSVSPPANVMPTASLSKSCTFLACSFDGSASTDSDGTIAGYAWTFGDGASGGGAQPTHTYSTAGTYPVRLVVTDDRGGTGTVDSTVTVVANQAPNAAASASCSNLSCAFDASASADNDGTIASYAWDFGDGSTGTGAKPSHAYSNAGTYTATVTVTDDQGATGVKTVQVSPTAPANQSPTASLTKSCTNLACAFDGTGSRDPDGSIASYAWTFGDGTTASTSKPTHTYAGAGTYTVTLVVTDDRGATDTTNTTVTVAPNKAPTAAFTQSCANLACSFDASGSSDLDGTIASYAWTFGDGTSQTGAKPSHTFTAAGTYQVTLTVTDNQGSTGTSTIAVTVAGKPLYASDSFDRTAANGWGNASTGGSWTVAGSAASAFAVAGGVGTMKLTAPGAGPFATLNSVSAANVNAQFDVSTDKAGTGGGTSLVFLARRTSGGDYRLKVRLLPAGEVHLAISRVVSGSETILREVVVSGLTYTPGDVLRVRFTLNGSGTTALTGKIWKVSGTEPSANQLTLSDTTAALQGAGTVGLYSYLSGTSTNAPVTATYDNVVVNGF